MGLECCRGAGSLILPCRMLGCTGNSHWKMLCISLHGMSLVVVVFLVVELILYVELSCGNLELLDCMRKHCSSCRMDGLCVETLYSKKIEVSLLGSSLSSSLEIILFAELLYLSG